MRKTPSFLVFLLVAAGLGSGQTPTLTPVATPKTTPAPNAAPPASDLNAVLSQMDNAAKKFKSAEADFKSEQYTALIKDTDITTGKVFSRRKEGSPEVAIQLLTPHPKQVVIKHNKVVIYDPRIKQTTEPDVGSKAAVESAMPLASPFGVKGKDLLTDYDVTLAGWEKVDGIRTAKLELVPRKESAKRLFSKAILWIDPERDVAVQQQRLESSGDYQLVHYSNIKLKEKISDDVFTIKKTGGG